jgi:hypothetical protein
VIRRGNDYYRYKNVFFDRERRRTYYFRDGYYYDNPNYTGEGILATLLSAAALAAALAIISEHEAGEVYYPEYQY